MESMPSWETSLLNEIHTILRDVAHGIPQGTLS